MTDETSPKPRRAKVQPEAGAPVVLGTAPALDTSAAANVAPASEFSPSGAPRQVTDIDASHPAVDNDPRAGTTENQNRIDFNDPSLGGSDAVAANLNAAG